MDDQDKLFTPQELGALGVGVSVTIALSLLTTLFIPIAFPFNFLLSLALGGTAGYGALKVLDPRTKQDLLEARTRSEYWQMLKQIAAIAARTAKVSQSLCQISPEVSERLDRIAWITERIRYRYQERSRDYSGASATLLILQKFAGILEHYLKVKCGELFLDKELKSIEIADTENHTIPLFEKALENLGMKLDAGDSLEKVVAKGTLESMLQSLHLIEDLSKQIGPSSETGGSDDQNT